MIIILAHSRQRTVFHTTRNIIKRLIYQSIETGMITAILMVLILVWYETMQKQNSTYLIWCACAFMPASTVADIWAVREYALPPLYGNAMLFVLNARAKLCGDSIKYDTSGFTPTIGGTGRSQPVVKVDTDVVACYDVDLESETNGRNRSLYAQDNKQDIPMHSI
ncbi:hypothetical protein HDZ31DRAFT_66797 [Schizophyllum fasciatum]